MKLKEIQDMINTSIELNNQLLSQVKLANKNIIQCENDFIEILKNQNVDLFLKGYVNKELKKDQISDLIHLFEFKYIKIQGYNTKILDILKDRRRFKLLVSYVHRVQKEHGFKNSVYWYNIHNKNIKYILRTDIGKFKKGLEIIKNN